ncbi:MAG: FAD-dependent oxidoreductase [Planctomycetes bacterium]|nr:FAD-dependent oxidoreductase [Planctomycetota bacterium]
MFTVAVLGGGAAGIGAARRLLQAGARVLLFDPAAQLGGNCVGLRVADAHGEPVEIDVGVSDFNAATFREFSALLAELGLETQPIGADAHFATLGGETLAAVQNGVFTVRPRLRGADRLEDEVRAFRERAIEALEDPRFANGTLADYLAHHGCSPAFRDAVLLPRAMGCFPMPNAAPEHHELRALLRFWQVHGLVSRAPSDRRCVVGGMHRYPRAFARWFESSGGELHLRTRVRSLARDRRCVRLVTQDDAGRSRMLHVDDVVLACAPLAALEMLGDACAAEIRSLAAIPMQRARVVVHRDPRLLGADPSVWGAYHYVAPEGALPAVRPTITFHPQRLARLPESCAGIAVSMNPHVEPVTSLVLAERSFLHPVGGARAERAAAALLELQGARRTWFAGAHLRAPYVHEPALRSGIAAAEGILARVSGAAPALARGA